jgi:hypothetical protein
MIQEAISRVFWPNHVQISTTIENGVAASVMEVKCQMASHTVESTINIEGMSEEAQFTAINESLVAALDTYVSLLDQQ